MAHGIALLGKAGDQDAWADFVSLSRPFFVVEFVFAVRLRGDGAAGLRVVVLIPSSALPWSKNAKDTSNTGSAPFSLDICSCLWRVFEGGHKETIRRCDAGWILLRDFDIEANVQATLKVDKIPCRLVSLLTENGGSPMEGARAVHRILFLRI
jgi:hypothetical protein